VATGTGLVLVLLVSLAAAASGRPAPAGERAPRLVPGPAARPASLSGVAVSIWPRPVRAGALGLLDIADRRATAAKLIECLSPPGRISQCYRALRRARAGRAGVTLALRAGRPGLWRVEVRAAGPLPLAPGTFDIGRTFRVRPGRLRLLATGDSEIQGIDDMLRAGLPGVGLTSEAHISTGISKPQMFDWVARAAGQATSIHPDITAVYIGANDGFALPTPDGRLVNCCQAAWIAAFARRTRSMMASYLRGGAGRVYWFTLPAPRSGQAAAYFRAINQAYVTAAASFPYGVHLIDIRPVFTPGGRYRDSMRYQGREVTVREPDGYHLSLAGDRIATTILMAAMRSDGVLAG
jgi:hypothetical protein